MKKCFIGKHPGSILFLIVLLQFHSGAAQDASPDSLVQEKLRVIRGMLDRGQPGAGRWWTGWLVGYGAATIAQGAVSLASKDKDMREDMALGAATTFLGAVGQIISPMVPTSAPDRLAAMPETTPEERMKKLSEAESLLKECALREKSGRSLKAHAITGIVNLGSGLVVWLGFKRSIWEGVGNFALNTAVTEAQIWTQPTRAVHDYDDYAVRYQTGAGQHLLKSQIHWSLNAVPGGLGIRICF